MYKTILAPLDGSKRAEAILSHVESLAKAFNAKVIFLEVIDPSVAALPNTGVLPVVDVEELAQVKGAADRYMTNLVQAFQGKEIEAVEITEIGAPVRAILAVAERENVDLIAMASHGRTGLARVFYGSVAAGVLHQTDRALLIVRAEED